MRTDRWVFVVSLVYLFLSLSAFSHFTKAEATAGTMTASAAEVR